MEKWNSKIVLMAHGSMLRGWLLLLLPNPEVALGHVLNYGNISLLGFEKVCQSEIEGAHLKQKAFIVHLPKVIATWGCKPLGVACFSIVTTD